MFAPRSSRRVPSRRCCREGWTYFRRITRRVSFFARYMTFCAGNGQTSYASFALQPEWSRIEPNRTAWVVRSSTNAPFIPLQISWQHNPCSLRVVLDASRRVAVVVRTERTFVGSLVAWRSLRLEHYCWQAWSGLLAGVGWLAGWRGLSGCEACVSWLAGWQADSVACPGRLLAWFAWLARFAWLPR